MYKRMVFKVVKDFCDSKDNRHVYRTGDVFPRDGVTADDKRIAELASVDNMRGEILIKAVAEHGEPTHSEPVEMAKIEPESVEKAENNKQASKAKNTSKKRKK